MKQNSVGYAGVAAMLVFAIGLLAMGKIWVGLGVLVFGLLASVIAMSPNPATKALAGSVGAIILTVVLGYHAASNEINGTATYHHGFGRHTRSEPVTRESAPAKFREATNLLWAGSIFSIVGAAAAFYLARKLHDSDYEL